MVVPHLGDMEEWNFWEANSHRPNIYIWAFPEGEGLAIWRWKAW